MRLNSPLLRIQTDERPMGRAGTGERGSTLELAQ